MGAISGIYALHCSACQRVYIGSSVDIWKRVRSHLKALGRGLHGSPIMQRSWTKYGPETFGWAILEIVEDTDLLLQREQAWLDEYRPEFNIATEAGKVTGFTFSEEQREVARVRSTEMWSDEKFRKETAAKIKAGWANPETRAAKSEAMKEHWRDNPQKKTAASEKLKVTLSTDEARAARSEQRRRDWRDPEKRERILAGRRAARERRLLRANAGDQE